MARNHGRVAVTIWQDKDFIALPGSAQRMYLFLVSQPNVSHLGVLPLTVRRWASTALDCGVDEVLSDLETLHAAGFVVVDDEHEEVLIRTLLRNDGVYKQPNVMRSAIASLKQVSSHRIKKVLGREVAKVDLQDVEEAKRPPLQALIDELAELLPKGSDNPTPTPPGTPREAQAEPPTHTRARPLPLSPTPSPKTPPVAALPDRFDEFWSTYPRRIGRGQAVKAWKTATKKAEPDAILTAAASFAAASQSTELKFIPHPSTWLNGERWADEPPTLRAVGEARVLTVDQMRGRRL